MKTGEDGETAAGGFGGDPGQSGRGFGSRHSALAFRITIVIL
jgi:hypothetical protein